MKRAEVKLTAECIRRAFVFRDTVEIESIHQTTEDIRADAYSVIVRGDGLSDEFECAEGSAPRMARQTDVWEGHEKQGTN